MAFFNGNQFSFAFGAADNSTNNNFANGFAPAGTNNMRSNGAYGNTPIGVPNYGRAYNALPQNISMGYPGLNQPMLAGMPTSHHPAAAAAQGLPMANGLYNAPMTYGMHSGMPMAPQRVQYPAVGFPMAYGHHNAAFSEQRPAPLVAPANLGNGVAHDALQFAAVAPIPVAQAVRPAEVIDLTNEEPAVAPSTPTAGTKRARGDRTSKNPAKPAKRPRYTAFGPYATPSATPVVNTPSVSTTPTLSSASASASDAEVLPATPTPSERPRVPRKRPEDPYNLRGNIYYTFVAPKNAQLEGNTRPVYSRPEGLPSTSAKTKRGRKGKKHAKASTEAEDLVEEYASDSTSEPASSPERVEAQPAKEGTDAEDDAEFELDEDMFGPADITPAAVTPAAATPATVETVEAPAAESTSEAAAPVEEERDDSDDIVFDDDGNVITDARGQPITLSAWRAKQAEARNTSSEAFEDLPTICPKAAALNRSAPALPIKRSFADIEKSIAAAHATIAAARKDESSKRPTKSQKKIPSQRSTTSQKRTPSQRPTVSGKRTPSQKATISKKRTPSQKPTGSKKQAAKRVPRPVSNDEDENDLEAQCDAAFAELADDQDSQPKISRKKPAAPKKRPTVSRKKPSSQKPAAVTQRETAESTADKRTLRDLEAKFGDYRQIRVKYDFEALHDAVYDAWQAVDRRAGPLEDRFDEMRIKQKETAYDDWEYSEDES
jgi:hypothetical protein